MPFAAPLHHRCDAFPKVRFCALCGWGRRGRKGGRKGGREGAGAVLPLSLCPSFHRVVVVMTVHVRYYILPPPWDHLIRLPAILPVVHLVIWWLPAHLCMWWLALSPRSGGHPPIKLALGLRATRDSERLDELWALEWSRWGADGSKHALQPYRTATFPFFPQC